jgi:lysosomal Pro-X carboxypeptidase
MCCLETICSNCLQRDLKSHLHNSLSVQVNGEIFIRGLNFKMCRFLLILIFSLCVHKFNCYQFVTKTYETLLDHFNFIEDRTFSLRYLVNETFSENERSPIFFYTGNEAKIEDFVDITGFMWRAAEELRGIVVFAEHRFYGESFPNDFELNRGYLSIEQALADFADLLIQINPNNQRPVIVFGGSYGGTLAAYMRMKYPHLVIGALASSAPVMEFPNLVPCDIYYRIITSVFKTSLNPNADGSRNKACVDNVKRFWGVLQ